MEDKNILSIRDLRVSFRNENKFVQVLRGVDIELKKGEILGILGESGSGKTVTASTVLRLIDDGSFRIDSGSICFDNMELTKLKEKDMRSIRGKRISYIFQDASAVLNPYRRVGNQLKEVLKIHGEAADKGRIIDGMKEAGIDNAELVYSMYPWQLSGGLCQRVVIAMSTLCSPEIIIADEPTTAIDASLQKKVLELLLDINRKSSSSIILITHDFDVVRYVAQRVAVMYGGLIMEEGTTQEVLNSPAHPYTKGLISCVSSINANDDKLFSLKGKAPSPQEFKEQCPFYDRCSWKTEECSSSVPELKTSGTRRVRCVLYKGGDKIR